jgi:hypothetical protein
MVNFVLCEFYLNEKKRIGGGREKKTQYFKKNLMTILKMK